MTVTDYADYQTPQAHADAISVTGAPLLTGYKNLFTSTPVNIGAGLSGSQGVTFTAPGYVIQVQATYTSTNGFVPYAGLQVIWQDPGSNTLMQENWFIPVANNGSVIPVYARGQVKGAQLRFRFINYDPAHSVTFNFSVSQTTFTPPRDDWRSVNYNGLITAPSALTNPLGAAGDALSLALAAGSVAAAANSITTLLLPVFAGQSFWEVVSSNNVAPAITVTPIFIIPSLLTTPFNSGSPVAGTTGVSGTAPLTRGINGLLMINTSANPTTWTYQVVPIEYAS